MMVDAVRTLAPSPGAIGWAEARLRLGALVAELRAPSVVAVRVPTLDPIEAFAAWSGPERGLWVPPSGPAYATSGEVARFEAEGTARGARIAEQATVRLARLGRVGDPEAPLVRAFGGLAFEPEGSGDAWWTPFGAASFVIPRWTFVREASGAWLLRVSEPGEVAAALAELDAFRSRLGAERRRTPPRILELSHEPEPEWVARIESIRLRIRRGEVDKVVAARRSELRAAEPFALEAVVADLDQRDQGAFRFAFERGGVAFVGATPERLVARRGLAVESEALAGSIAANGVVSDEALLASAKDRSEQAFVWRYVRDALTARCRWVDCPEQPSLRRMADVVHLRTRVQGELRVPTHVLELVDALHPTPAVGGVPVLEARRVIAAGEPEGRGWYSGPIGSFDVDGDGEFAVALRCALVAGDRARVYAGAGIVAASDPRAEYAETALKLRPALSALGVG